MDLSDEKHLDIHCFKRDLKPDTFVNLLDLLSGSFITFVPILITMAREKEVSALFL